MNKTERIKELTSLLNKASYAYYGQDNPIMSDKEYDDLYDELSKLEEITGIVLAGSPTQKVQGYVLDRFKKVEHSKPMLSAAKTKDIKEIKNFLGAERYYCSYKLDGLTLVVKYKNGKFVKGITRGNGTVGEDVTEQCRFIQNLPMTIPFVGDLELRGECVISWEEFERINSTLNEQYSHPRNLASGTLRNLNLNIVKERKLSFIAFELVHPTITWKTESFSALSDFGFECVKTYKGTVEECIENMKPKDYQYPVDGLIFEFDNTEYSKSLGNTSHHENCRMALKWTDELYKTVLRDIEWNTSKTGLVNPVAVFDPVDLDGAITTKSTLHNLSYIEDLELGIGDTIQVYRANMVIPKVHENLTRSNTWKIPNKCPTCGGNVEIHNENRSKTLHCTNPGCQAKLLGKLVHFVSKNATNIEGLSEQTLEKFIELGWVKTFKDLYTLSNYKEEMSKLEGFGKKSVEKLVENIEKSRSITLDRFIYSLSIPLIGRSASKTIAKEFDSIEELFDVWFLGYNFTILDDFGDIMNESMQNYINNNYEQLSELIEEFTFEKVEDKNSSSIDLFGKTFVITGSLNHYKNRDELVNVIESLGGKVSGSVSVKTSYLINNDVTSTSGKNKKAKELSIPIISEDDFINMIKEN